MKINYKKKSNIKISKKVKALYKSINQLNTTLLCKRICWNSKVKNCHILKVIIMLQRKLQSGKSMLLKLELFNSGSKPKNNK